MFWDLAKKSLIVLKHQCVLLIDYRADLAIYFLNDPKWTILNFIRVLITTISDILFYYHPCLTWPRKLRYILNLKLLLRDYSSIIVLRESESFRVGPQSFIYDHSHYTFLVEANFKIQNSTQIEGLLIAWTVYQFILLSYFTRMFLILRALIFSIWWIRCLI